MKHIRAALILKGKTGNDFKTMCLSTCGFTVNTRFSGLGVLESYLVGVSFMMPTEFSGRVMVNCFLTVPSSLVWGTTASL